MTFELIRFACTGLAAMMVHFMMVAVLVPSGVQPLAANCVGFLVAFQVSFLGHSRWTFRTRSGSRQYFRLFLVSAAGFALNESCYALLLETTPLDYRAALAAVLAGVAGGTYLTSKLWVFNNRGTVP